MSYTVMDASGSTVAKGSGKSGVRVASRSIPPPWGSIQFRLALRTYAPWGCIVRVVSRTESRKIPARAILPLFFGGYQANVTITVPNAKTWSPASPNLYDVSITVTYGAATDTVLSYFGLRTFVLGDGPKGKRPLLNGEFTFMAGFLDQSYFPDGQEKER